MPSTAYDRIIWQESCGGLQLQSLQEHGKRVSCRKPFFATNVAVLRMGERIMTAWIQDIRYALRQLRKSPGFSVVAITTLALGIGANTAIFSVVNAVLLRPLPFKESEYVVVAWNRGPAAAGGERTPLAVADLLDWRGRSRSFAEVGAFQNITFNYITSDSPERVQAARVTANFFSLLGVQAQYGRTFLPEEERPGAQRVAVLSNEFWRKYFAADPKIVGRTFNLNGVLYTVVGIVPAALDFPAKDVVLWTALQLEPPTRRGPYFLTGIARLRSAVSLQEAHAEMSGLTSTFSGEPLNFSMLPVNEFIVGNVRLALLVLLAAVTLVLLIAAVNVANLMLVRSAVRAKEISIRAALGASRAHVLRQLLAESLVLVVAGGVLGMMLATAGATLLLKLAPNTIPRLNVIGIDGHVLGWTALISLLTGVSFGMVPAWQSSRLSVSEALKEGERRTTETLSRRRWRNVLVVSELALAVVLLVAAGLLIKSFRRLERVDSGVNTDRVLTMRLALRGQRYVSAQRLDAFYPRLLARIQTLPGVRAVTVSNSLPPDATEESDDFTIEGRAAVPNQSPPIAYMIRVSADYFRAFSIPLRRGRFFSAADSINAPLVALINETAARRFFPHEDPIGKRINIGDEGQPSWWQIVGVVGDVKYTGLADEMQPALYQPLVQAVSQDVFLSVKTAAAEPLGLVAAVRNEIRSLDPELPVSEVGTMEQRFATAVALPRFRSTLIALFAVLALVLAVVGIYGVISYSVTRRTHEIGIRLALGAQTGGVLKLVLKEGAALAITGVLIGSGASFALTGLLESFLFNVSATDWSTFGGIAVLLTAVALLACYVPARRAARVDPMVALRYE
jgi:predicted permease